MSELEEKLAQSISILRSLPVHALPIAKQNALKIHRVGERVELEKKERAGKHVDHVYCLRFGTGPIKFGYSANLGARVRAMHASHWEPITILGAVMGDRAVERQIHAAFAPQRIESTEWFKATADVIDFAVRMQEARLLPEVQASLDMYRETPVEHLFTGARGEVCLSCGREGSGTD